MAKVKKPKPYARMNKREKSKLKEEVTKVNERIGRLEKSGISSSSAAYRYLQAQYAAGATWLRKDRFGNIRVKGNISKMSADKIDQLTREITNFKRAKTSTVSGTKQARAAMVESFNERLSAMGIEKRIKSADEIKDLYENALYKSMQKMYYSERMKLYDMATEKRSKRFLKSIVTVGKNIPPDDVEKMLESHKEYEKAVKGLLSSKEVQDLMIKEPIYNRFSTPQQFREYVEHINRHTEEGENLLENVEKELAERWF